MALTHHQQPLQVHKQTTGVEAARVRSGVCAMDADSNTEAALAPSHTAKGPGPKHDPV
jgi:hypothetical protein